MIPVAEALDRIRAGIAGVARPGIEEIPLTEGLGRILAEDLTALVTQPPSDVSAMDGWAVRAADIASVPVTLRHIGTVPAGGGFDGTVEPGTAVRLFTGAPVPKGADTIVIQEDTTVTGDQVTINEGNPPGRHIRVAGLDFKAGDVGLPKGKQLTARDIGLAAAMNRPWLKVARRPRVAILATGDEVVRPGDPIGPHQIVSSNAFALGALIQAMGGIPLQLGIAPDDVDALRTLARAAEGADLLLTTGGASVGDYDLVRSGLMPDGLELDFWKIAMRPGKPLIFGRYGRVPMIGLPGNPVSTLVCALVFVRPAIAALLGQPPEAIPTRHMPLAVDMAANDKRQDYVRAEIVTGPDGKPAASPFARQDSSMMSTLARSDCLVIRPPNAPPAAAGTEVEVLDFAGTAPIY